MNERIKEFAHRCGFTEYRGDDGADDESLTKFAELIVKECAGIYSKIDNGNDHLGTDDYLEALHKTFFGVEE